jgi:hypothetical protein
MLVNPPSFVGGVPFPFETTRALDVRAFVVGSLLVLVRSAGNVPARRAGSDP